MHCRIHAYSQSVTAAFTRERVSNVHNVYINEQLFHVLTVFGIHFNK